MPQHPRIRIVVTLASIRRKAISGTTGMVAHGSELHLVIPDSGCPGLICQGLRKPRPRREGRALGGEPTGPRPRTTRRTVRLVTPVRRPALRVTGC